jgi:hypothetical protein
VLERFRVKWAFHAVGAKWYVPMPQLRNTLLTESTHSVMVEAPTEMANSADAGEYVQALVPPFPAATTTVIPAWTARLTA